MSFVSFVVLAVACPDAPTVFTTLVELLNELQTVGVALSAGVAGVMIVYSGYLWMISIDGKDRARQIIVRVIIGMSIVLLASGIVSWIEGILCGTA